MNEIIGLNLDLTQPDSYSKALQKLIDEHPLLKKEMERFYYTASLLAYDPSREDRSSLLQQLHDHMNEFFTHIKPHQKEEQFLFDLLSNHITIEISPIKVMEDEHKLVMDHLNMFLENYKTVCTNQPEEIRDLTHHVSVIFHTLTDHFLKEEEILFPLAENLLSMEEKDHLFEQYSSMKTA